MIEIVDKHNCCGCSACVQVCPKRCISFNEDEEGFRYPLADKELCIDCHLCETVCPCLNQNETRKPLIVYAAINPDEEIRKKSSSGGVFSMIAEVVIGEGGVVFGARFDDHWEVVHDYTETKDGLVAVRGSKYVQSRIGDSYIKTRDFLKLDRQVLFSGTSCQIAGLKQFLRKDYDNLITVEVVCHGVPSPKIWRDYISSISATLDFSHISMKDKSRSWRRYNINIRGIKDIVNERASQNKYMLAFKNNLSIRQSCFNCPAKAGKSNSDITLADYWGIEHIDPNMDDDMGTSFVCVNTEKGLDMMQVISVRKDQTDYDASVVYNSCMITSTTESIQRDAFWKSYHENGILSLQSLKPVSNNFLVRIIKRLFLFMK